MAENPFVFGTVVSDENFTDRKNEIVELVKDLTGKTNLIIFSPRRYGKTSLIFQVVKKLQKKGIICVYVDLYPVTSKAKFANIITSAIVQAKAGKIDEVVQVIRNLILPFKLTVRPEIMSEINNSGIELELSKGKEDMDANLTKLYDLPERIARKKKKRMVVIFDEFQEIAKIDGKEIENNFRTKIQQHKNVSYVFMGSQRHLLDQMFNDRDRALYRSGKPFSLCKIPENEFRVFIKDKFQIDKIQVPEKNIDAILQLTGCHPYYTQQLCHEIWNLCKSNETKIVKDADVSKAIEQVMKNQNYAYMSLWDSIRGKQRILLSSIASSGNKKVFSSSFREKYSLGAPSTVARAAATLEEKGLIEKEENNYVISDTFFKEWLKRMN